MAVGDPPPLKWSDLKYVLWHQGGLAFGVPQQKPSLGDVLVFWRGVSSGFNGHVAMIAEESKNSPPAMPDGGGMGGGMGGMDS